MTSIPNQTQQNRNKTAAALMFVAVMGFSLIPLFVAWGGSQSPFIFNAMWKVGLAIVCVLFVTIAYRSLIFDKYVWKAVAQNAVNRSMLLWLVGYVDFALYAWSTQFIDVSVSAILFETSPILLILLTGWLFRDDGRYRKITARTLLLFAIAFVGVAAVIASQTVWLGNSASNSILAQVFGICLVLSAAAFTSLGAFGFKWAAILASDIPNNHNHNNDALELFSVVIGIIICTSISVPLTASVGVLRNEPLSYEPIVFGVVAGVVIGSVGTIVWRKANLVTHNLSINAMAYFAPVLSLVWLFALSLVGDVNIMLLLFGAVLIIMANVLIYLEFDAPPQRQPVDARDSADATALIAAGESDRVEFKSTLRTNLHTNRRDRAMEAAVTKTLAAFLNSDGGALVIGVADDGAPVGIAVDGFGTEDRMSLHLRNIVNRDMGPLAMAYIRLSYEDCDGVRVMVAHCERSDRPVYVKDGNAEKFYIRTGPSTTELVTSATVDYIRTRFQS